MNLKEKAALIDHTNLSPYATQTAIARLCEEATTNGFCSVCVLPYQVAFAASQLKDTPQKVCTVIGFPLGANRTGIKAKEAQIATQDGAEELDMVINLAALKEKNLEYVQKEIEVIRQVSKGLILKVILETCYLDEAEKISVCRMAQAAGADFVKTSTGFGSAGANLSDIMIMRQVVGDQMGIKASGGIRNAQTMEAMLIAGATRIGSSSGIAIMKEYNNTRD